MHSYTSQGMWGRFVCRACTCRCCFRPLSYAFCYLFTTSVGFSKCTTVWLGELCIVLETTEPYVRTEYPINTDREIGFPWIYQIETDRQRKVAVIGADRLSAPTFFRLSFFFFFFCLDFVTLSGPWTLAAVCEKEKKKKVCTLARCMATHGTALTPVAQVHIYCTSV